MFVGRPVRLLAFYRAVSGRIATGASFSVGSVADSTAVNKVQHF